MPEDAILRHGRPGGAPCVSYAERTRLVVNYIEKLWCSTLASSDLPLA